MADFSLGKAARHLVGGITTVVVAAVLVGCGGGEPEPALDAGLPTLDNSGTSVDIGTDTADALAAYDDCLAEEGVEPLTADASPDEVEVAMNDPAVVSAMTVCAPLLEAAAGDMLLDAGQQAELIDSSAEFAECARSVLGIDVPDDVFLLESDDPRSVALDQFQPTPEQETAIIGCVDEAIDIGDGDQ